MSTLVISDLSFLEELDNRESKVAGASSSGAGSAADWRDSASAAASTTNGYVNINAEGGYRDYGYYGSYERGPSVYANASDRYYY